MPLEYNFGTMMMIDPDELDKLEQAIDGSGLDEPTRNLLIGTIAARRTLIAVLKRLFETPENSRDEIFQEIAELLDKK
jgi:hypothetical protein